MKSLVIFLFFLLTSSATLTAQTNSETKRISIAADEQVWVAKIVDGDLMPLKSKYQLDLYNGSDGNQLQPLVLTSKGQYIWSDEPFSFVADGKEIVINDPSNSVKTGRSGSTLREAQRYASKTFFPASGKLPDTLLFSRPQYNTWIELTYNQNQEDVLKYARGIIDNGFPAGVIMIDDTWQEDYGLWKFHPGRFPDPKRMIDSLHQMGFKVMVWVCPFVSADQFLIYNELKESKAFLLKKTDEASTWSVASKPLMVEWWNGQSAELDFSNPAAVDWFNKQLDRLVTDFGVDGFKFDAGDMNLYPANGLSKENASPNRHCELFAQFGLRFPLNEYRACWKMGGQPLVQRLRDKSHTWEDLQKLIPGMILEGLSGYPFSCPDMIGGGEWTAFLDKGKLNQDLIVRSAQCHALMPMMQFSVAPWRVLDSSHLSAVKKAVAMRMKFTPLIMQLAHESAQTGEPILKSMEFVFPNQGFEKTIDQFMLGDKILVAPVVDKDGRRAVKLPAGKWKSADGKIIKGNKSYSFEVPIDQLLFFELQIGK